MNGLCLITNNDMSVVSNSESPHICSRFVVTCRPAESDRNSFAASAFYSMEADFPDEPTLQVGNIYFRSDSVFDRRARGARDKHLYHSSREQRYLRKILIHGARAVVLRSKRDRIAMGAWMTSLETRAPRNVLIVATAHKLARIAWAVLSSGQDYRAVPEALTV
jgi:hypothetical protein